MLTHGYEKKIMELYNTLSDVVQRHKKSNELGAEPLSHFILEKTPLPLLFNCIFFGAKVIINFAQGDEHEPVTRIYNNAK